MKKLSSLMTRGKWIEEIGEVRIKHGQSITFQDVFDRFAQGGGDLFEVGCYPGTFSAFMAKKYDYRINGIDFIPSYRERIIPELLHEGVRVGELVEGDFLEYQPTSQYDLVCSFGFIEHFTDTEEIITKHINLVKKGGILILTCPNFHGANYFLHKYFDAENLKNHNLDAMNLNLWRDILDRHEMQILFHEYYGTFGFWGGNEIKARWKRIMAFSIHVVFRIANSIIDHPSSKFSPYIVSVSRKKERGASLEDRINFHSSIRISFSSHQIHLLPLKQLCSIRTLLHGLSQNPTTSPYA